MMRRKLRLAVLLIGVMISLSACAFGDRTVMLSYPPQESAGGLAMGRAEAASAPVSSYPIVLMPLQDNRPEGKLIGEVLNGYGMRTADVNAGNDVGRWVTDAIKWELQKAGYQVKVTENPGDVGYRLVLSGEVVRVFCTAYMTYKGDVGFAARLEMNGEEVFRKRYLGTSNSGLNWAMTAKSYDRVLGLALKDAVTKFMWDLNDVFVVEKESPSKATQESK